MNDDSISCSPGTSKQKSRCRSFHKTIKRKYSKKREEPPTENYTISLSKNLSTLEVLYEESVNTNAYDIPQNQLEYFNPFENENILAAADRAQSLTSRSYLQGFRPTGFVRLESAQFGEINTTFSMKPPRSPQHELGTETQFGITESEFVRFCDDAESNVLINQTPPLDKQSENNTIRKTKSVVEQILNDFCGSPTESEIDQKTPKLVKQSKSIVDEILEDFCGSPFDDGSPPEVNSKSQDSTPIFRFKSQPIRTYSGVRRKKPVGRNIATDLNVYPSKDDGNSSDSSSGLSVQEDFSQTVEPQLDTVDLNNSVRLCENLLNLSSYFSQLPEPTIKVENTPQADVVNDATSLRLGAIVDEIIALKSKSLRVKWFTYGEPDFCGFSDYESDNSAESTLQELLEDGDDILREINCDSLCYEKVEPKSSLAYEQNDLEQTLKNATAVIDQAKALMSLEADIDEIKSRTVNCDNITEDHKDENLFEDNDIWNDNECLLNYKTQQPKQSPRKTDPCCSTSLKLMKSQSQMNNNIDLPKCQENQNEDTSNYPNCARFTTASKKPISISETAREKAHQFLQQFAQELEESNEVNQSDYSNKNHEDTSSALKEFPIISENSESSPICTVGFSTASKKPIAISNKAKKKADEMLKKFEQEEQEKRLSATSSEKVDSQNQDNKCKASGFVGFSTASEKPIAISLQAKRKADEILKKFDQVETETNDIASERLTQRHPDEVSEEVRRKAQELLLDIEFFEEAFEDELKEIEAAPVSQVHEVQKYSQTNIERVSEAFEPSKENPFTGFQTASRKPIEISDEARRRAEALLKSVQEEELPQEFLKCIENEVKDSVVQNSIEKVEQVDGALTAPIKQQTTKITHDTNLLEASFHIPKISPEKALENLFGGFRTASKKTIKISDEAKRRADALLKTIQEEELPEEFLKCIASEEKQSVVNKQDVFPDGKLQQENDSFRNVRSLKRKHSEDLEIEKQFSITTPRRSSCCERTPLNGIENGLLSKSPSLPLPKATLISRKNLLSLSKRKKTNSSCPKLESVKTPEKNLSSGNNNTYSTPNLKGFFDSVSTSTPRLIRQDSTPNRINERISKEKNDSDCRQLKSEETKSNPSNRVNRTGVVDEENVTFSQISPSPQQRIDRLKMYGEPPPISPILMLNKCRTSGLRRGRSLMKP